MRVRLLQHLLVGAGLVSTALTAETARANDSSASNLLSAQAAAEVGQAENGTRVLTLPELLALAKRNYPKVHEARARLAMKRAQLREAHTAPFSEFTAKGGVGVAPTWRGTTVYSPNSDAALTDNMALAWQVGVEGIVPLWTFGKISNLWNAADANVDLGKHELAKAKNEIGLEVRKAFYGLQLARDSILLVDEALGRLDEYVLELEADVAEGGGDEIELLKTKMQREELLARSSEARKSARVALAGLRFYTGAQKPFDIPDLPIEPIDHQLGPLGRYLEAARLHRPEINMARAGVRARKAQVQLEKSKFFPDLGLGLTAQVGRAPEIANQRNPFAYDPANFQVYGFGLVMRWKLDFLPQSARIARAKAQLEEVRATERFALGGVATEVEKAFEEAEDARRRMEAWSRATQYAKQWLIKVQQGIDLGLTDEEDLVEPSKEYALKRFEEMSAIFDYNVALAKLSLATGWQGMLKEG